MFRFIGLAFLSVLFFACNLFNNLQAEDPGKQEDVFSEEGAGLREPSENDVAGITEDNGETRLIDDIREEGRCGLYLISCSQLSNKLRSVLSEALILK